MTQTVLLSGGGSGHKAPTLLGPDASALLTPNLRMNVRIDDFSHFHPQDDLETAVA